MGRTLSWNIKTEKPVTDKENDKLVELSKRYNKDYKWTCENFWIDQVSYYPNWEHYKKHGYELFKEYNPSSEKIWEYVNKREEELTKELGSYTKAVKRLKKEGILNVYHDGSKNEIGGFCKVAGNEFNAQLILLGLIEISKILKNSKITLSDEGDFLYCPVIMKNGIVWADYEDLERDMGRWVLTKSGVDKSNECYEKYADDNIKDTAEKYAHIMVTKKDRPCPHDAYISSYMWELGDLHRPVRPEDFKEFPEWGSGLDNGIMAGFYGEYYGKKDEKYAKEQSNKMTGMIMGALGSVAKDKGIEIQVQPRSSKEKGISLNNKELPNEGTNL